MRTAKTIFSHVVILCVAGFLAGAEGGSLLCVEVQAAEPTEVFIDFEHRPNGSATGSGPIGDDYAEWGVRFQTIGVDTSKSPIYSRFLHDSTYAHCGACSYPPGHNIVADFDMPVYSVSAQVTCAPGETVTMIAKHARGMVLGSITSPLVSRPYAFVGPIEVTSEAPIASVEWWPSRDNSSVGLDNVRILAEDTSPPDGGQTNGPGHLVAYWNFNEGQGDIAHDVSGHDNHGTLSGPVDWVAGYEGTALSFTGTDNHVRVEDSAELNPTEALTVAAWINPIWTGNNRILQKDSHDNQYRLLKEHGDNLVFDLAGVTNGRLEHYGLPPSGEWTHVAATYDGFAMKLYYGAALVDSQLARGAINTSTGPLTIGSKYPGAPPGDEYRGLMDELRIYDRALTAGQIQALMEWLPPDGVQITDITIMGGELVGGLFQPTREVSDVGVGDVFQVVVEVTNFGDTTQQVTNLYNDQVHPESRLAVVGGPSVCIHYIALEPGQSALLYAFCPGYAYEAQEVGSVTVDIDVTDWSGGGLLSSDTFSFEIGPPPDGVQVTDVTIIGGELVGGLFQPTGEVSDVAVGDVFEVVVEVTNFGDTMQQVTNLYHDQVHPESHLAIVGGPSVCIHYIALEPGQSALLYAFCPGYAYEAQEVGWVTIDIDVRAWSPGGSLCTDTFSFEIGSGPPPPNPVQVTDVTIIGGELVGGVFQPTGEVSDVAVGDVFEVVVEVTNFGDTMQQVTNLYHDQVHPESRLALVGGPSVCIHYIALEPGQSALLHAFCPGYAYEAQETGWVTIDIDVRDWSPGGSLCTDTLSFEIGPPEEDGLTITDVTLIQQEFVDGSYTDVGTVSEVAVGDFFRVEAEVTNLGDTTRTVFNRFEWSFSGPGSVDQVGAPFCIGLYPIDLEPGESAVVHALCQGMQAFQAVGAGWVTMHISVGLDCEDTFTFEITSE